MSRAMAERALNGVGDASLGEWIEYGNGGVVHVRRRLSVAEAEMVNPLRDIRGTEEEGERLRVLVAEFPRLGRIIRQLRGIAAPEPLPKPVTSNATKRNGPAGEGEAEKLTRSGGA